MDFIDLSKILPLLIYPFNLALWLMVIALFLLFFRKNKWAGSCFSLSLLILFICGNPLLASTLYAKYERNYLPIPVSDHTQADAIVVLGGAIGLPLSPRLSAELVDASDRLLHATRLFQAGKAPVVILTGGNAYQSQFRRWITVEV